MNIILKENETMQDLVDRLAASFELVIDIAPVAYWYENLYENGRLKDIHFSNHLREMLGYASEEEFPDDLNAFISFLHPDDVNHMLEAAIAAGTGKSEGYDIQYRIRRADGSYLWAGATGELVKTHDGKTVGMYGAFIDVTEEVKLREKQENERRTREVINGFSKAYDAAFYGNIADGTYQTLTNVGVVASKVDEIRSFEDAMKSYVTNFVHPDDAPLFDGEYTDLAAAERNIPVGGSKTFEYRSKTGGDFAWYRAKLRRITETEVLVGFKNCDYEIMRDRVADKLMSEYDAICVADLDRGEIRSVLPSKESEIGAFQGKADYVSTMRSYAAAVAPEYRKDWMSFSDPVYMKRRMAEDEHREYVYELPGARKTMRRFSADVLKRVDGEASEVLFSFMGIDNARANTIRLYRQLAEQQKALAEHRVLLEYFMDQYWSACFIDLKNDTLEVLRANNANSSDYIVNGTVEDMRRFVESRFHPDDLELMRRITDKDYVRNELKDRASLSYIAREMINGEERTMRILIVRGADEDHVAVGFVDVTDEILEQKKHLLGAVPVSPDVLSKANIGLWAFELDEGQPPRMYGDEAMLRLVGLERQVPPEEMYHAWYDYIDPASYDLVTDAVAKMSSGEHAEVQYPWHHPDGHTMIVRCGGVRNPEYTQGIRIEGTHQDVTETLHFDEEERKRAERQRLDEIARVRAEAADKAKTEFLFNMSHDIRTPMNAILGFTDIAIRHGDEPEKVSESLKKIKTAGGHLLSLINDILEMSRIEAGALEIVNAPVDIREALDGIDIMSRALAVQKSIDYSTVVKGIKNTFVYADELHINQIMINLISNAVKYTNHGGKVEYLAEQISEPEDGTARYRFTVTDTGIGMSEEFQRHLFQNFVREKDENVSKQEGTGLGLAIVKRITDMAGGTISVKSEKGRGSVFVVELPFRVMDDAAIARFTAGRDTESVHEESALRGRKVLLVEDNEMNREIATELLTETGLSVDTAEDGEIAVRTVSEKGTDYYDFILMDIQMPVMNGYEATRAIRALPGGSAVPIIALSANAFEEDRKKSVEAGMNAHVAKPIDVNALLSAMRSLK